MGESGSGKSTIFALVERFYDPEGGQVLIDGVDLRELDPKWYHRQVAIVSQEPILFSGSIKENIMYGKMDATDAEVVDAARAGIFHLRRILAAPQCSNQCSILAPPHQPTPTTSSRVCPAAMTLW